MTHYMIYNGEIELEIQQRETRANRAAILKTYIALNDTIGKSPVYHARELWNTLCVDNRNIDNIVTFKSAIRKEMNNAFVTEEIAKLTAGLFI